MELFLYAVRNSDGKWFRRKGYGGYGQTWVDDFTKARIYPKIGQARARITWFAKTYPAFPAPDLVKLVIGSVEKVDETGRIKKTLDKAAVRKARLEKNRRERELQYAQESFESAKKRLETAKSSVGV